MRYDVAPDGSVSNGRVFADVTAEKEQGLPDGMKVDTQGNICTTGPGGVWVFSPDGTHLGTVKTPEVAGQLHLGRRRQDALHHSRNQRLPYQDVSVMGEKPLYQTYSNIEEQS